MKKLFLCLMVAVGTVTFASSPNTKASKSIKIDDVKFIKGTCVMRLTYTNPNTGQRTTWTETYETATAEECGNLLTKRIQQLSMNTDVN
ncbi:hypothetical protein [uncultured Chryseobacterium sp.]|uniref:hypothetical protein n=1 Tax=uncultured Chryseobacterium sp. TaxID=259322 RepID=UPI00258DBAC4|nr:hypothetical protein [uncultured Chryseobacterium sp.]